MQWKPQARTDCFSSQSVDPIKIQSVISLFIMLSAFVVISIIIYITEVLIKRKAVISAIERNSTAEATESQYSVDNETSMGGLVQNQDP